MISDDNNPYPLFPGLATSPETTKDPPPISHKRIETPIWTHNKAHLIAKYLRHFTYVTKHGAYIDGFAGPQYADQLDSWSAKLTLLNKPGRLRKYFLFDKDPQQVDRIKTMVGELPPQNESDNKRTIEIEQGDCNEKILEVLDQKRIGESEATFALLDQRNFECNWKTLVSLATYKPEGRHKIELFYFLPSAWFHRAAKNRRKPERLEELNEWWGNNQWRKLLKLRSWDRMMLLRERFEKELGYTYVTPLPIYESQDGHRVMYFMIHASDHRAAPTLMRRAYGACVTRREPVAQTSFQFEQVEDI